MSKYKCKNEFTDTKGKRHSYGEKISDSEYSALRYNEQSNYDKEVDSYSSSSSSSNHNTPGIGDMLGTGIPGGIDMDFTTPL